MRERLLSYIHRLGLMRPGDRIGVAVSGGADSVALLRLLLETRAELGIVLSVVHFNHKIRGDEADADEKFVRGLARGFHLELHSDSFDTPAHARFRGLSLEAAARELRYAYFNRLTAERKLDRVATAHTRDDQAETVLLRFLRGSGTRGLAGIHPQLGCGAIVRPLLEATREGLRAYLRDAGQPWREDASNRDLAYARNRVRHQLLPLLTRDYNPALAEVLSDAAEIARAEEEYWQEIGRGCLPTLVKQSAEGTSVLLVEALQAQPVALQRRLLRAAADEQGLRLEFHHVEQVLALTRARASALQQTIELPHGWEAVRQQGELRYRRRREGRQEATEYDLALPMPSEVAVAGKRIRAALATGEALAAARAGVPPGSAIRATQVLLDAALAQRHLRVRNWRAGDRYWPAHTSGPKKLKELLQAKHIPREQKPSWPVVVSGDEILWVPRFAAPEQFLARDNDSQALMLEEVPAGIPGPSGEESPDQRHSTNSGNPA